LGQRSRSFLLTVSEFSATKELDHICSTSTVKTCTARHPAAHHHGIKSRTVWLELARQIQHRAFACERAEVRTAIPHGGLACSIQRK
jgi:hypothetical protein